MDHGANEEEDVDDPGYPANEDDADNPDDEGDVPVNLQRALDQAKLRGTEKRLEIMFALQ